MFSPQTLTMFVILAAKGKIRRDHDQRQHKQSWSLLRSTICVLTRFDESRFSTPGRNAAFKSVQKIKGDLNKACSCSSDISTQPILNRAFKIIKGIKLIYRTFFFFIFQMKRKEKHWKYISIVISTNYFNTYHLWYTENRKHDYKFERAQNENNYTFVVLTLCNKHLY